MKNKENKPFELQHIPTLKVEITPDQAQLSNQVDRKLPQLQAPPPPNDLSKKDVITILQDMKKTIQKSATDIKTLELIHILDFAIQDYAKCMICLGKGKQQTWIKPDKDYYVRMNPKGIRYYLIDCKSCSGSGKQLSVHCASCGEDASIMPDQNHFGFCHKCEARLVKSGNLL